VDQRVKEGLLTLLNTGTHTRRARISDDKIAGPVYSFGLKRRAGLGGARQTTSMLASSSTFKVVVT
jgi:hypothetical protein